MYLNNQEGCPFKSVNDILEVRYHHVTYIKGVIAAWNKYRSEYKLTNEMKNIIKFARFFTHIEHQELVFVRKKAQEYIDNWEDYQYELDEISQFVYPNHNPVKIDPSTIKNELQKILNYTIDQLGDESNELDDRIRIRIRKVFFNVIRIINYYKENGVLTFSENLDFLCEEPVYGEHCADDKVKFPDSVSPSDYEFSRILSHPIACRDIENLVLLKNYEF